MTKNNKNKGGEKIRLVLCFARSGGTLLSKCLGVLPDVIILSEINPEATWVASKNRPSFQAGRWYHIRLKKGSVILEILQLFNICNKKGKKLIVRDFSYGSFVNRSYNSFCPSRTLHTLNELRKSGIEIITMAFVRDPIDVWLSMNHSEKKFHDHELSGLRIFIEELIKEKIKIFKYEDFCKKPRQEMRRICKFLDINYSSSFINNFSLNNKITGDVLPKSFRNINKRKIKPNKKGKITKEESRKILRNKNIKIIQRLLKY